jgi:hypothetical protein
MRKTKSNREIDKLVETFLSSADRHYESTGQPHKSMRLRRQHLLRTGKVPTASTPPAELLKDITE